MKNQQRIPTLVALLLLIVGIGSGVYVVENVPTLFAQAFGNTIPQEVKVSNISDTSFSVSWLTDTTSVGYIKYGKAGLLESKIAAYDSRDHMKVLVPRKVHSVTITGLDPESTYEFEIVSGTKLYAEPTYLALTGPVLGIPPEAQDPAFGKVVDSQNEALDEGIVYASFSGSQMLSSLIQNGNWMIPLGNLRSSDGTRYFVPRTTDLENLLFLTPRKSSEVTTTIEYDSPVGTIEIGKAADFTKGPKSYRGLIIAQAQGATTKDATSVTGSNTFAIIAPQKGAGVPTRRPTFTGSGVSGKTVILTVSGNNQKPVSAKVIVTGENAWTWTPENALLPGNYTITATSFSKTDKPVVISQPFMILKSGTQVLQAATPSASFLPSPTPRVSAAPSATVSATPKLATATPSASSVPVTGTTDITWMILIAGFALSGMGLFTLYNSH